MNQQLSAVIGGLHSAQHRLGELRQTLSSDAWQQRPRANQWSAAECVAHLNLSSAALIPVLRAGLDRAVECAPAAASRYRRDPVGWLIWHLLAPAGGLKTRAAAPFVPAGAVAAPEVLIAQFEELQSDVIACVHAAEGRSIDQVTVVSPFDARVRYNLFAALTMVPRHQHRHLLQAQRAARALPVAARARLVARPS